ncbi:cytochrome c [Mucilaginibacter robiniae]|uniref:Cytochrome c n=1 Tax=Mucilaginibacter robiniae TaxID=2728022 RepID=A0A7L5E4A4_9SPHI|nr:cytochrome c [Mucilaginibacter robiniae]QJD97861.1 cytochrome c [Mucilaginibacter robiniae]
MKSILTFFALAACLILFFACQNEKQIEFNRYYASGQVVYQTRCQNCHGAKGEGLAALIPPLTDSIYLKSHKDDLACYVQNGLKDSIVVHQKSYSGQMPSVDLAPVEIAQVLTYIQNSFGNKLGLYNVEQVNNNLTKCK